MGRKYAIELMPVKSYKRGLVFLMTKKLKGINYHYLKLANIFPQ